jgi:hypothetical protein
MEYSECAIACQTKNKGALFLIFHDCGRCQPGMFLVGIASENSTRRADARIIAATNQDLKGLVAEKRFRHDLYCRINVFPLAGTMCNPGAAIL